MHPEMGGESKTSDQAYWLTGIIQQGRCMPFISGQNPVKILHELTIENIRYLMLFVSIMVSFMHIFIFLTNKNCKHSMHISLKPPLLDAKLGLAPLNLTATLPLGTKGRMGWFHILQNHREGIPWTSPRMPRIFFVIIRRYIIYKWWT